MKKTIFTNSLLAALCSLSMSGYVFAHHPSEDMNPNFDFVDEQVSDMHNEIIDAMLEDDSLMGSTSRSSGASDPTVASGDAVASQAASQTSMSGAIPAINRTSNGMSSRAGAGR